jgi:AcrR family transcriptional regulator
MRVTHQTRLATRQRIVTSAAKLFSKNGWAGTTTRDIATSADIATGTLFNYFQSKEAVAAELIATALSKATPEFAAHSEPDASLEESLFNLIWTGLKGLREFRHVLRPALDTILSPLARSAPECPGDAIRADHLEAVEQLILAHGVPGPLPALTMQIYWTLYIGVAGFWAADDSPHQEDTMALLDQSIRLFTASLAVLKGASCESE